MNETIAQLLEQHGVRPTAVRILIWRTLASFDFAFALSDLEGALPTVDRSTLFRALTLFTEKEMLHSLDDGSGQHKYCVCQHHSHQQCQHVHLSCTKCGRTFCLKQQQIPQVSVPEGFEIQHISYIIQGICPHCAHKTTDGKAHECCCHNA